MAPTRIRRRRHLALVPRASTAPAPDEELQDGDGTEDVEDESELVLARKELARNQLEVARFSNEVIALVRSGVPLRDAWTQASQPLEEPASDAPGAPIRRAREAEPLDLFSTFDSRTRYSRRRVDPFAFMTEENASGTSAKAPSDGPHREAGHAGTTGNAHPGRRQDVGGPEPRRDTAAIPRAGAELTMGGDGLEPSIPRPSRQFDSADGGSDKPHKATSFAQPRTGTREGSPPKQGTEPRRDTAVPTSQKEGTSGEGGMPTRSALPFDPCEGVAAAMPRVRSASWAAALRSPGGSVATLVQVMSVDRFVGEHMPKTTGIVDRIRQRLSQSPANLVEIQAATGDPPAKLRAALDYQRREKRMAFDDEGRWYIVGEKPPRGGAAKKSVRLQAMVRDKLAPKPLTAGLVAGFPPPPRVQTSTAFVTDLLRVRASVIESAVRKVAKLDELIASHAE